VALPAPGVAARAALALIRAYKLVLSPWFTGACRFMPTCADYTAEAIARHGLVRGSWLGARRLGRCHPFGSHGHDPVPTSLARSSDKGTNATRPIRLTGPTSSRSH
jgi:putative membrane protein insertion efficiency factor